MFFIFLKPFVKHTVGTALDLSFLTLLHKSNESWEDMLYSLEYIVVYFKKTLGLIEDKTEIIVFIQLKRLLRRRFTC